MRHHLLPMIVLLSYYFSCSGNKSSPAPLTDFVAAQFDQHDLHFEQPPMRWDEAIPLGNGMMGVLVWGDGHPLKLSLDRADLWDTRPVQEWSSPDYNYVSMRKWVREGRIDDLHRLYDLPYKRDPGPTKIPAGRIEITLPEAVEFKSSHLSLSDAIASISFTDGRTIRIYQHATHPIGILSAQGFAEPPEIKLAAPSFGGAQDSVRKTSSLNAGDLARLGYPAPKLLQGERSLSFEQQGWGSFRFAVCLVWKQKEDGNWQAAWSIASSNETDQPLQLAEQRAKKALADGFNDLAETHQDWWKNFWRQSRVAVPNQSIERQWYLETYKFGAVARRGAPPITLQAVWTADEGKIPPWKGDYHHDLNTELSYWPCYSGNHLDEGLSYLDWLWATLPQAKRYTQVFFNKPGFCVPMTADIEGKQIGGWHQYTHSATVAAWLAHHFYLHWRYSMDRVFLQERAYPYLREASVFLEAVTEKDARGKRYLPLSSSPEINDNRLEAWLPPTSNYDLALMRWLFAATAELAGELGKDDEQRYWLSVLAECPDFSFAPEDGRLLVAPGLPLKESHRHFSHLMAIHPLGLLRWENGESDQRVIRAALDELDRLGTDYWCGYSFAWLASLAARAKDGERAERALEIFAKAFCSPNSFHLNGDQTKSGYSKFTYRPFTLEGNMAAAAGLQEMLLQSYGGVLRIFPAIPDSWQDVSFYHLRGEGAFLVSVKKENGRITKVEIIAEAQGPLKVENPFMERAIKVHLDGAEQLPSSDSILEFRCQRGARVLLQSRAS